MKSWTARSKEEAYLLNPAFCCTILAATINDYVNTKREGVSFPLLFMVLPIVLHKPTRDSLPPSVRTSMAAWLQENAFARVLFYERLVSLKPHTREAIQFGMLRDWVVMRSDSLWETTLSRSDVDRSIQKITDEARECMMRARFVGRWFAVAGTASTIMALWGVRP